MHSKPGRALGRIVSYCPRRAACLSLLAVLGAFAGCARKPAETESAGAGAGGRRGAGGGGAVPVVVAPVLKKEMPLGLGGIGAVESMRSIAVKSFVTGTLMKVNFSEGREVKQGDLLFEIDPRPFENALHSAEADLEKTTAQLETAEAEVARYATLVASGMVSKEQFQNLQIAAHTLRATIVSNQSAIANAKLQLEYCFIRAPFDGRTGSLGAHEGDLVRASDPNIALVTVTQISPIYVTFALPQQALPALQHYQAAGPIEVVATPSAPGAHPEGGRLTFLDSAVDATSGTIKLKATFANPQRGLWPGQFVRVNLTLATLANQIVVPAPAVQAGQKGQQVYVVRGDQTVELRPVSVDRTEGGDTVIAQGLNAGETVVVDGQIRLRPNAHVLIRPPVEDVPSVRGTGKARRAAGGGEGSGGEKSKPADDPAPKSSSGTSHASAAADGSE